MICLKHCFLCLQERWAYLVDGSSGPDIPMLRLQTPPRPLATGLLRRNGPESAFRRLVEAGWVSAVLRLLALRGGRKGPEPASARYPLKHLPAGRLVGRLAKLPRTTDHAPRPSPPNCPRASSPAPAANCSPTLFRVRSRWRRRRISTYSPVQATITGLEARRCTSVSYTHLRAHETDSY